MVALLADAARGPGDHKGRPYKVGPRSQPSRTPSSNLACADNDRSIGLALAKELLAARKPLDVAAMFLECCIGR